MASTILALPESSVHRSATVKVVHRFTLVPDFISSSTIALDVLGGSPSGKKLRILSSSGTEVGVIQWSADFVHLWFPRTASTLRADLRAVLETQTTLDVADEEWYLLALFSLLFNWQCGNAAALADNVRLVFSCTSEEAMPLLSKAFEWASDILLPGFQVYSDLCNALTPGALHDCVGRLYTAGVDTEHLFELMGLFACSRNVDVTPFCKSAKHPLSALVSLVEACKDITDRSLYYMTVLICEKFEKK
jgi:hypothetical protein